MWKDKKLKLVPHGLKYHAEIMYETQDGFNFDMTAGNTIESLLRNIKAKLNSRKGRRPMVKTVLLNPNTEAVNITDKILNLLKPHTKGVHNEQTQSVNRRHGGTS